jgi:hypothetical protein
MLDVPTTQEESMETASRTTSPVDNGTYNLMQALVSKLEAIEAYGRYAKDDGGELFQQLLDEERDHAERLLGRLKERLQA